MAVEVKLTSVKPLSNTSTSSIIQISNFNFQAIVSALKEFLSSINYVEGESTVTIDVSTVSADLVNVRNGLRVYGARMEDGNYPTAVHLQPNGSVLASNFIAEDVTDTLRLRLRVYGALPSTGIPGELVYIEAQGTRVEGIYVWLTSTGWTLLAGSGGGGQAQCMQEVIISAQANTVTGDSELISSFLFLVPAPLASSNFTLYINGLQTAVGDSTKLMPAYLSKDGGTTPSSLREADSTDLVYWNASVSGYSLADYDTVTLHYFTIDPFCAQSGYSCITQVVTESSTQIYQFGIEIIGAPEFSGPITVCKLPTPTSSSHYTLPDGYYLENSVLTFSITDFNSIFPSGAVVKFTLPYSISQSDFDSVRIFHLVGEDLIDETVLVGPYAPDYANRWIFAQVSEFSPFYLVKGIPVPTTTTTSTTTIDPGYCPPNEISFVIANGTHPTSIQFYGSPEGPHYVIFTDQLGSIHDLTGLLGEQVLLPWTFDITNLKFSEVSTLIGIYKFTYDSHCEYEIEVPISVIDTSTTTTTTAPTTTTSSTTTTTVPVTTTSTTIQPTTTTTTTTIGISYAVSSPVQVQFFGSPNGPYTIEYTDQSDVMFDLSAISGSSKTLPWTFNRTLQAYVDAGITTISGKYDFKIEGSVVYTAYVSI